MNNIYLVVYDCPHDGELNITPFANHSLAINFFYDLISSSSYVKSNNKVEIEERTTTETVLFINNDYSITISLVATKKGETAELY